MADKTGDRIPISDMRGIITKAMDGLDLTHSSEWRRPPECSCNAGAQSCLLPASAGSCQGYAAEIDTPEQHQVTAELLISALPGPDADGTVDTQDAARSVISAINARLVFPYSLRLDHLRDRLVAASEEYEAEAGLTDSSALPEQEAGSGLKCQVCSGPLPSGSKASRRTCSDRCRQAMKRMKGLAANVTAETRPP